MTTRSTVMPWATKNALARQKNPIVVTAFSSSNASVYASRVYLSIAECR
ncbi:hypothetical protein ACUXPJ_000256 [Micrococcus luteus]